MVNESGLPDFTQFPDEIQTEHDWHIKRASHLRPSNYFCVSADYLGLRTHFRGRRTVPHLRTGCFCLSEPNLPAWHGYVLALAADTGQRTLFEFTPGGVVPFIEARKQHRTLRGLKFVASRAEKRSNGRVVISIRGPMENPAILPPDEPIWPVLCHLWKIPPTTPGAMSTTGSKELHPADLPDRLIKRQEVVEDATEMPSLRDLLGQIHMFTENDNGNSAK